MSTKVYEFLALTGMRKTKALACTWKMIKGMFIHLPSEGTKTECKAVKPEKS